MPFAPSGYQFYRNVKSYGATGDGTTDDTAAINRAITDGNRCGNITCGSTSVLGALVYFPVRVKYYFHMMYNSDSFRRVHTEFLHQ